MTLNGGAVDAQHSALAQRVQRVDGRGFGELTLMRLGLETVDGVPLPASDWRSPDGITVTVAGPAGDGGFAVWAVSARGHHVPVRLALG